MPPPAVLDNLRSFLARQGSLNGADTDLLDRFVRGRDGDAFAALLERHGPMVLGLARRVLGDGQLAEDAFQAAFLLLARKAHTLRRPEALPCWLHAATLRLALRARRSRQRALQRDRRAQRTQPRTPLEELTARELLAALDEELGRLPETSRAVLVLCCLEGRSQEEAARALGCSAGAVKGRLERGREQLRRRLQQRGLTLPAVLGGALLTAGAVPPALAQATLQAVRAGACASSAVNVLLKGAMRTMLLHRLKVMSAAIVLLALSGGRLGLALREQPAEGGSPPAAPAAEQPQKQGSPAPKTDRLDAPLPEGAIARLGSLRLRVGSAALGFSSDGKTIITVRGGRQVKTWDADTGKLREERELPRPVSSGTCLSADGRWLAAQDPDFDTPIDIWDVFAGKRLHRLRQSKGLGIYRAEFSPGGKMLAVAPHNASEGVVYLWDMKSGEQRVLQGAAILPNSLAFSPDGKLLAAASGRYVVCWNTANGERLWRIEGARDLSLAFTPDARTLIVAPGFQRPTRPPWRALDAATGKPSDRLKLPEGYVNSELAVAPDGRTLVFAQSRGAPGSDGRVRIWDLGAGKLLHTLDAHGPFGPFSPDGRSFLTNDGALQRWHLATGQPLLAESGKQGHTGEVTRVIYSPDGRRIASTSRDATIRLWDVATALPLHILRGHEREAWGLAFTPDGKRLVSGCSEGELFIWDTQSGKEVRRIPLHDAKRGEKKQNVSRLHVTTDGQTVVVLGYDPSDSGNSTGVRPKAILSGWDLATGRRKSRVEVPLSGGLYTAFSPDGKLLASQGQLLDTATGRRRAKLEGRTDYLGFYASSSDGRLVTGLLTHAVWEGNRGMTKVDGIAVWDAGSGRELRRIPTDWVGQIAFSPDCRYLVAADLEGLRLWELASGQVVLRHKAHDRTGGSYGPSFASCLSFAPDGRSLATGHSDSTILVWDMAPLAPAAEMPRLWQELADSEASRAYASSWRLTDSPREALRLLRRHLRPAAPAPAEQARRLLADLDSEDFARREAAAAELRQLGDRAEKALREALAANPSLEKRRRLEKLLKVVDASPTPHMLRQLRAVAVLERIGNEEARKLLKELAEGDGDIRQTRAARASLQRLAR